MCDYLNELCVKCFKIPYIEKENDKYIIKIKEGNNRHFINGDTLPMDMPYYKYDKNLGIYNFLESYILHIVKNGVLINSIRIEELSEKDIPRVIINESGQKLNINNIYDIFKIKEESLNAKKQKSIIIDWLNKNKIPYSDRAPYYEDMQKINKTFINRWYINESNTDLKELGILIYCSLKAFNDKEFDVLEVCREMVSNLREKDINILQKYKLWQNLDDEEIEKIGDILNF